MTATRAPTPPLRFVALDGRLVRANDAVIGVWNPAAMIGVDDQNAPYVGYGAFPRDGCHSVGQEVAYLVAGKAVVLSDTAEAARAVAALLDHPASSRTVAYLCCLERRCETVAQMYGQVRRSRVALLGCGGIGSLAAVVLAGAGVGRLRLVDHDLVESSNLNRQLFWTQADVGRRKVEVLRQVVDERFANVEVEAVCERLADTASMARVLDGCDAALLAADDPLGLASCAVEAASRCGAHLVCAGYSMCHGHLMCRPPDAVGPDDGTDDIQWSLGPGSIAPSYGPLNLELAGQAADLVLAALAGAHGKARRAAFSFDTRVFPRAWVDTTRVEA